MLYLDMFKYIIRSLIHRGVRTWLTVIGIVIGIIAIVMLISIAQGLNNDVMARLRTFGTDNIIISPGKAMSGFSAGRNFAPTTGKLFMNDYDSVKSLPEVDKSGYSITSSMMNINYKGYDTKMNIIGISRDAFDIGYAGYEIEKGRLIKDSDRGVVVIGHSVAYDIFDDALCLGSKMKINGKTFRVIGILKKSSRMGGDNLIIMSLDDADALTKTFRLKNEISAIYLRAINENVVDRLEEKVHERLRSLHKVGKDNEDFTVVSAKFYMNSAKTILGYLTLFLGVVAGVSLVVGGIGIANAMFMSVTERIPEIGILKSIGAKDKDILDMFLIEGGLIGLVGGVIGVIVSLLLARVVGIWISIDVTYWIVLFSLLFSFVLGLFASYLPARQASRLDVLDALGRR
ncbi:ABC transporter permease [Candidatus Micrarchaeota archaeon]|nr:ABC transporter permease [Candidatus Micrarchaeota archaeon]